MTKKKNKSIDYKERYRADYKYVTDKVLWDFCEPVTRYGEVKKQFIEIFQAQKREGNLIDAQEHHLGYRRDPIWRNYINVVIAFVTDMESNKSAVILGEYMQFGKQAGASSESLINQVHKKYRKTLESKLKKEFNYTGPITFFGEEE